MWHRTIREHDPAAAAEPAAMDNPQHVLGALLTARRVIGHLHGDAGWTEFQHSPEMLQIDAALDAGWCCPYCNAVNHADNAHCWKCHRPSRSIGAALPDRANRQPMGDGQ